jgi:hypothetical protein
VPTSQASPIVIFEASAWGRHGALNCMKSKDILAAQ